MAMTYGTPIVMANHCGERGGRTFWGGSRIMDPFGRVVAQAGSAPELLVADLDFVDVEAARRQLPTMRDTAATLARDELRRIEP
jgi:predicted amidohydrolase